MLYLSTNRKSDPVSFSEALLRGQAPDRGLYMPVSVPALPLDIMAGLVNLNYDEIAFRVASLYMEDEIQVQELKRITRESYDFKIPLEQVTDRKFIMRLDQGPTASFKDFAARMMGRLMQHYLNQSNGRLLILTATSGDTGSAVANAFYGLDNIQVVVLFPRSEVTERQRRQMTTLGKNVHILALDAKFDDCQALVKKAFADMELNHLNLSSANSINIGRLIPQVVYYFYAWSRLARTDVQENIIFSVPSGNFGDMMGGILALKMGLPVKKFVIATNENDEFPNYLNSGTYRKIEPSRNCISSAMNVGHPSNLARLVSLYGGMMDEKGNISIEADMESMRRDIFSVSIDDAKTRETIQKSYRENGIILEPHGAVGWAGLHEYLDHALEISKDQLCVSIETAHPAKFPTEIRNLLGLDPSVPPSLAGLDHKPEFYNNQGLSYTEFKTYLLDHFG